VKYGVGIDITYGNLKVGSRAVKGVERLLGFMYVNNTL